MPGVDIIVRNDAGVLVTLQRYLDRQGWELTQNAEEGSVGISTLYLDDIDESIWTTLGLDVGGRRQIRLVDLSSNRIVHFGYTAGRRIRRRFNDNGSPVRRAWSIEIWDPNTIINRRVMKGADAKRPRETDVERIEWLITTAEWDLIDQFLISSGSTKTMSKADYRGQMVNDIISDCAQQAGKNYWVDITDQGAGDRLTFWYGKDSVTTYPSTLSISNDVADLDLTALRNGTATVYPPSNETEYQMDPSRVFTGVMIVWEKGSVYRHSDTAATQFERWDTVIQAPNIHEKDRAVERALNMVERLSEAGEDVRIESGIQVPASKAHLVRAGMRIPVKLTHIPEMTSYTDCRILSRGLSPRADGAEYWVPLILEPIGPADVAGTCSTSLSNVVADAEESATDNSGSSSATFTPEAGEDSAVIIGFLARNRLTPDSHGASLGGTATDVYDDSTHDTSPFEHPTWAIGWDTSTGAGDYTASATWTPSSSDYGSTAWVLASFRTASASPVQSKFAKFSTAGGGQVTMTSSVTAGNMIAMVVTRRDSTPFATSDLYPTTGWTQVAIGTAQHTGESAGDAIGIYMRCVESGDAGVYGVTYNGSKSHSVTAMEWAIT